MHCVFFFLFFSFFSKTVIMTCYVSSCQTWFIRDTVYALVLSHIGSHVLLLS